jgi:NAD(P)-dependent dehydrogenase (short-subunit alcohol dehydrogenase family)
LIENLLYEVLMMKNGKVALIVGGGSGIGAGAATHLAENGWQIGVLSSSGKGEALAKKFDGVGVTGSNLNVADLQKLVDDSLARFGRIDAVVSSAGHGPKGDILDISDEDWHLGMDYY